MRELRKIIGAQVRIENDNTYMQLKSDVHQVVKFDAPMMWTIFQSVPAEEDSYAGTGNKYAQCHVYGLLESDGEKEILPIRSVVIINGKGVAFIQSIKQGKMAPREWIYVASAIGDVSFSEHVMFVEDEIMDSSDFYGTDIPTQHQTAISIMLSGHIESVNAENK